MEVGRLGRASARSSVYSTNYFMARVVMLQCVPGCDRSSSTEYSSAKQRWAPLRPSHSRPRYRFDDYLYLRSWYGGPGAFMKASHRAYGSTCSVLLRFSWFGLLLLQLHGSSSKWISHFAEGSAINHSVLGISSLYYPDRASPKPAQPSMRSSGDLEDLTHGMVQLPTCSLIPQSLGVNSPSDGASLAFHYSVRRTSSPYPWAKPSQPS